MNLETIKAHFSIIRDERQSAKVDYPLFDLLFGSICAIIAGGQGWTDIREYVLGHQSYSDFWCTGRKECSVTC